MSKIVEIDLRLYNINEKIIDNVASEFYGKLLAVAGNDENVSCEFDSEEHATAFLSALKGFKKGI